jgi:hypothetical protein
VGEGFLVGVPGPVGDWVVEMKAGATIRGLRRLVLPVRSESAMAAIPRVGLAMQN